MKSRYLKLLTIMILFVCINTFFIGCQDDQFYQPTMAQIETLLLNDDNEPIVNGATKVDVENILYDYNAINSNMLDWQRYFEKNNIDTTYFKTLDIYRCIGYFLQENSYATDDYYIYVFKFSNCESSANCKENINRYDNFSAKQYGNLVVYAENIVAGHTFALIDTIQE